MEQKTKTKRSALQICRCILIIILVLLLIGTVLSVFVPQYEVWKGEHGLEQVALTWLNEVRVAVPTLQTNSDDLSDINSDTTDSAISDSNSGSIRYNDLYNDIKAYNEAMYADGQVDLRDVFDYEKPKFDLSDYGVNDDIFGVISIPKINVIMPLYLGATYRHMNDGFAQMANTSIPIGGENTNSVIVCHRGWNRMAYLRDVEMLEIGDSVYVHNLWEDLEYRVVDIHIITPSNLSILEIQDGRDLLTLFTCHPYGVNTHRYVVVCERYDSGTVNSNDGSESSPHLMTGDDVKHDMPRINIDYITNVIRSVMITTIDTSEGSMESSQQILFWTAYFPWMLLCVLLISIIIYIICRFIRYLVKKIKRKKNKRTLSVRRV